MSDRGSEKGFVIRIDNSLENEGVGEKLRRLITIGFSIAGTWIPKTNEMDMEIDFVGQNPVEAFENENILYAFIAAGELKYIGKTVKGLKKRMAQYQKAHSSQRTNARNRKEILECFVKGQSIEVYVLPDNGLLRYGGFHINLAAGLEDSLIKELDPPWNGGRKETDNEDGTST